MSSIKRLTEIETWIIRPSIYQLESTASAPSPTNDTSYESSHHVADEIPTGVHIAAHAGLFERAIHRELDDFIERTEAHPHERRSGSQSERETAT